MIFLLVLGFALWVWCPIIGIFPLLFFVYLDENFGNNKFGNIVKNLIFLLVLFTITIFCSTREFVLDTSNYVNEYNLCGGKFFIECIEETTELFEPAFFFLSSLFFMISGGSEIGFIFLWSLTINSLVIFVICKGFSTKYQPILIMLTICNPSFYFQTFLMRQFMGITLFLCAIVLRQNKLLSLLFFIAGLMNHYTVFMYFPFIFSALILRDRNFIKQRTNKYWIFYVLFTLVAIGIGLICTANKELFTSFLTMLGNINGEVSRKGIFFLDDNNDQVGFNGHSVLLIILTILYIYIPIQYAKATETQSLKLDKRDIFDKIIAALYSTQVFLFMVSRGIDDQFALRTCLVLLAYTGLFFYFPLENSFLLKRYQNLFIWSLVSSFSCLFFGSFLQKLFLNDPSILPAGYLGGKPFSPFSEYIFQIFTRW